MKRKYYYSVAAGLLALAICAAAFYFRPVNIQDGETTIRVPSYAWSVGQALASAGISLNAYDQVKPPPDRPVPLNGQITIQRAVLAYLWEDGQMRATFGLEKTLRQLLDRAGVELEDADRLLLNGKEISLDSVLPPGKPLVIQILRAVPVILDLDGQRREIRTSAASVGQALWDAGVRINPGDRLSHDADAQVEPAMTIGYQAARTLTILAAGRKFIARSAAETTGSALAEVGFALQGLDYSLPGENEPLPNDGQIHIVRVREEILLTETLLPFDSQFAPNPDLELDLQTPVETGQYGVQVIRERIRYENEQEVSRVVDSDWTAANPTPQIIGYGTKVVTRSENMPDGTIEYWRKIRVRATSYSPCRLGTGDNRCNYTTASGARLTKGIIGVSLKWFRAMRGQRVYIPGYGFGVIGDYGAVSGMWIDLGFDEENFEEGAIVGWVDMYFLTPVPANILWTLP